VGNIRVLFTLIPISLSPYSKLYCLHYFTFSKLSDDRDAKIEKMYKEKQERIAKQIPLKEARKNKLDISRTGGHYFLIIDSYEIGLPLSALKEIIGLALMMMPPEHAEQVFKEWYDVVC